MCYRFSLKDQDRATHPDDFVLTAVMQTGQAGLSTVIPSIEDAGGIKRAGSPAHDGQRHNKKAKTSHDDAGHPDIIEISDNSPHSTLESQTPVVVAKEFDEGHNSTSQEKSYSESRELAEEQDIQFYRDKANRILKSRNAMIQHLKAESTSWQSKVVTLEVTHKLLSDNIKKIEETMRKKVNDLLKADFDKKAKKYENDFKEKLEIAKSKHIESFHSKEVSLREKFSSKEKKLLETIESKRVKIDKLEQTLSDVKVDAKKTENDIREQHRKELSHLVPEHSDAMKDLKVKLKTKEALLEKWTNDRKQNTEDTKYYQEQCSLAQERNDVLQRAVRENTRKVLSLQGEVTVWKQNATEFERARDEIKKDYESKLKTRDQAWFDKYDKQYKISQESNIAWAEVRRGTFVLNQANDRNNKRIKELEDKLMDMGKKLAEAKKEISECNKAGFESEEQANVPSSSQKTTESSGKA